MTKRVSFTLCGETYTLLDGVTGNLQWVYGRTRKKINLSIKRPFILLETTSLRHLFLSQKCGTATGTSSKPPYGILFMADLEENILNAFEENPI